MCSLQASIGPSPDGPSAHVADRPMVAQTAPREARPMPRSDREVLADIRAAMARLGQLADDRTDEQLRATAIALVGDRPDALEVIARALTMRDDAP
jgi:hypothetical protein